MEDNFNRYVGLKKGGEVLYERAEPLFPMCVRKSRVYLVRAVALILAVAIGVAIWIAVASGTFDESFGSNDRPLSGNSQGGNGAFEDTLTNDTEDAETERETVEESNTELEEIEGSDVNESIAEGGSETETEPFSGIGDTDLSMWELGESYIVNYSGKTVDISGLLDSGFVDMEKRGSSGPLVMVIHTHTSEKYFAEDGKQSVFDSVVSVGDELNTRLNSLGLTSIHCTVIHDSGEQNAYLSARETIKTMLKIYPSIRYIIDLHRLELYENDTPIKTVSGTKDCSAQIRLSVSSESGWLWQEDLSLALALRRELNGSGDRICMPTVLSPSRYNSDLSEYYIMADIGSCGNTADEARAAARRLAEAMAEVILE